MKVGKNFFSASFGLRSLDKSPSVKFTKKAWKFARLEEFWKNLFAEFLGIMNGESIPLFIPSHDVIVFIVAEN